MKTAQARALSQLLNKLADDAESTGKSDVYLNEHWSEMDDQARVELQQAIAASRSEE